MVPVVLTMVMAIVQFAVAAYTKQVAAGAVQDGAATAALLHSSDGEGVAVANDLLSTVDGWTTSRKVSVSRDADQVVMWADATVVKVFPLFPTITVHASSSASIEKWETP